MSLHGTYLIKVSANHFKSVSFNNIIEIHVHQLLIIIIDINDRKKDMSFLQCMVILCLLKSEELY
jgi:hypothetical protein